MKGQVAWLLLCAALHAVGPPAFAQDEYSIRVESNQVLVPAMVYDKDSIGRALPPLSEAPCPWVEAQKFLKLPPDQAYIPLDCNESGEVNGLTKGDFHIFEDGVEQKIQNLMVERRRSVAVRDNFGYHLEHSDTPTGKWSTSDLGNTGITPSGQGYFYLIAYVPQKSEVGKCHQIRVKVNRRNSIVWARSQYCYTGHSSSDTLRGTPFGEQLQVFLGSAKAPTLDLSLQVGLFYGNDGAARVDMAAEFPWNTLKHAWAHGSRNVTIGILEIADRTNGSEVARVSDLACCDTQPSPGGDSAPQPDNFTIIAITPTRYETQINLPPPGEYNLRVVLSDGENFGHAEVPLAVEPYDAKQLAISSVMLCKRFRVAAVAAHEAAAVKLAPEYVPLVSKGIAFTPAGDTRFKKGEPLFAYFEVYEPLFAGTPAATVQTQIKITDIQTGELKVDTGSRSAAPWIESGKIVIPIAEQIAVDKLPKGSYKLEVQASDSAGKSTVWRAASFTVE